MSLKYVTCIEDLRAIAQRKVPKMFFDYLEDGSYSQKTLHWNRQDLSEIKLRQKVLRDVADRDLSAIILGDKVPLPFALAPVGLSGMIYGDGEIHACKAALAAGIPYTLSNMSVCSIEDVAEAVQKPFWFQLYFMKDRGFVRSLVERAIEAKCSALVLTVDVQVTGQRHSNIKNGFSVPPRITLKNVLNMATKPAWCLRIASGKRRTFGNLVGQITGMRGINAMAEWSVKQLDQSLCWKDVDWLKSIWPGKLIIKGILDVEDAKTAMQCGASAIVVSNHGGRQLDGAPSSISVLPEIVDAVGSEIEIIFDSGITSGQDVFRALALGASSCLLGRSYVYGLGAGGQAGVAKAIEIIRRELDVTMALAGAKTARLLDRNHLMSSY